MHHGYPECVGYWVEHSSALLVCDCCGAIVVRDPVTLGHATEENVAGFLLGELADEGAEIMAEGE